MREGRPHSYLYFNRRFPDEDFFGYAPNVVRSAIFAVIGAAGMTVAQHAHHTEMDQVKVTRLSRPAIVKKLDGKVACATIVEAAFNRGNASVVVSLRKMESTSLGPRFFNILAGINFGVSPSLATNLAGP